MTSASVAARSHLLLLLLLDELRHLLLLRDDRLESHDGFACVNLLTYFGLLPLPKYWGALWLRSGFLCFCLCFIFRFWFWKFWELSPMMTDQKKQRLNYHVKLTNTYS